MHIKRPHREKPRHVVRTAQQNPRVAAWHARVPASWRAVLARQVVPWLADAGSLTLRLQRSFSECRVQPVAQGLHLALPEERWLLAPRLARGRVLRREVVLHAQGVPRVFARSVLVPRSVKRDWPFWRGLGQRSLGARLFADPRVQRTAMWFARLRPEHALARRAQRFAQLSAHSSAPVSLFARYSLFTRGQGNMLLAEVFLPACLAKSA